jgi:hypothetical protein
MRPMSKHPLTYESHITNIGIHHIHLGLNHKKFVDDDAQLNKILPLKRLPSLTKPNRWHQTLDIQYSSE